MFALIAVTDYNLLVGRNQSCLIFYVQFLDIKKLKDSPNTYIAKW